MIVSPVGNPESFRAYNSESQVDYESVFDSNRSPRNANVGAFVWFRFVNLDHSGSSSLLRALEFLEHS